MSEKLTFVKWKRERKLADILYEWDLIEAHAADCVAEAVAEVKKTHFAIGDRVALVDTLGRETIGQIVIRDSDRSFVYGISSECIVVRRPQQNRSMTDDELDAALSKTSVGEGVLVELTRPTLEAMAKDLGISTVVIDHE